MSKSSSVKRPGNTEPGALSSRNWFFTYNNFYNEFAGVQEFRENLENSRIILKFLFQHEKGEHGTEHLQGIITLNKAYNLKYMKDFINNKIHWEIAKNVKDCLKYCSKSETRIDGPWFKVYEPPEEEYLDIITKEELFEWQLQLLEIIKKKPCKRSIYWIYDPIGGAGKTIFMKWLIQNEKNIFFTNGGRKSDIINYVYNNKEKIGLKLNWCLIYDFPRKVTSDYISYDSIENVKDGVICNNKYECGSFICNSPHIIIFSNHLPNTSNLSKDRWIIKTIKDKKLIDYVEEENLDIIDESE